ncbi:putative tight adherance operon protein [Yersinia thracica]|uniref:Putative tight adherance operon protein n=1 Tax=Yersinia thracica TaxID=2890319 RepID=A0A0T9NEG0_9GAMM|nr:tight adherence pilus pseudopilin TadF [Yersinia thracica]CNH02622.1 putative tight adherance operon protein [Yersinia thracica]
MHKKTNQINMIKNTQGAVVIEFVFVVFITTLFIKTLISVADYYATVGKLDRISYSLAGIVRERTRLYNNDRILTQEQVNQIKKLADNMLLSSGTPVNNLAIKIETLHFNQTDSSTEKNKSIDDTKSLSFNIGACEPDKSLNELTQLSTFSNAGRWIPLYQVTLCLSSAPGYETLFAPIKSSSITVER